MATARSEYCLTNPFGLKRYFYSSDDAPAAVNFMPQSTAAIIMWKTLVELNERLKDVGGRILNTIHDAILCEIPEHMEAPAKAVVMEVMQQEWREIAPGFRVPVKVKVGRTWGECE